MEGLATVLFQLDLLNPHCLADHLTLLLPRTDAVRQAPIHGDREPLLGNLVACLHTNMGYQVTSPYRKAGSSLLFLLVSQNYRLT